MIVNPEQAALIHGRLLGFFSQDVLSYYRDGNYSLSTDYLKGQINTVENYTNYANGEYSCLGFGYRTLADGSLAIAIKLSDLAYHLPTHVIHWQKYHLTSPVWLRGRDDRFVSWIEQVMELGRQSENDRDVLSQLSHVMHKINDLTDQKIGRRFFTGPSEVKLVYPPSQTTSAYRLALNLVYTFVMESIEVVTFQQILKLIGPIPHHNCNNDGFFEVLKRVLLVLPDEENVWDSMEVIDKGRNATDADLWYIDSVPAAFEIFEWDIQFLNGGMRGLRRQLIRTLDVRTKL